MELPHLLLYALAGLFAVFALLWAVRRLRGVPALLRRDPLRRGGEPVYGAVLSSAPPRRNAVGPAAVTVRAESPDGRRTWEAVDDSGLGGYDPEPGTRVEGVYTPADPSRLRVLRIARADGDGYFEVPKDSGARPFRIAETVLAVLVVLATAAIALNGSVSPFGLVFLVVPAVIVLAGLRMTFAVLPALVRLLYGLQRSRMAEAEGTVTDTWTETRTRSSDSASRSSTVHCQSVRFTTADGRRVHRRDPIDRLVAGPAAGGPVRVRYVESAPELFATGTLSPLNVVLGQGLRLVLGPVLIAVGLSVLSGFL
ncbi:MULTISPECIES: DUF3592 domain-containing protein [unclassified Nocardiopsis]|uniref:DUF3592 domain-containing protein n=1 Tax=Nocardiopsis TaxID=2013 RepID=UPI00387B799F